MRRRRGFSLLELLIAVAVLAVLAAMGFRGLGPILDAQVRVQAEARRWADVMRVMEQLGRDLSLAVEPPRAEGAALVIRRRGEEGGGPSRVAWRLRESRLEYLAWHEGGPDGSAPLASTVLDDAEALELRVLRADGSWSGLGSASASSAPPRAVEVRIALVGGESVMRIIPLP